MNAPAIVSIDEVEFNAIRAQGAGGQNVNKVSTAIHLRFDIRASSLTDEHKETLLALSDQRLSGDGVIVIKSQSHRSQEQNKADAFQRLQELVTQATTPVKDRKPTRPTRASRRRRLDGKASQGQLKASRRRVGAD